MGGRCGGRMGQVGGRAGQVGQKVAAGVLDEGWGGVGTLRRRAGRGRFRGGQGRRLKGREGCALVGAVLSVVASCRVYESLRVMPGTWHITREARATAWACAVTTGGAPLAGVVCQISANPVRSCTPV